MTAQRPPFLFSVLVMLSMAPSITTHLFVPALPALQRAFAVDTAIVQLTLSVALASIAITTVFYGPLSDSFGRRPIVIAGMGMFLAGSVLCLVAAQMWVLVVGRVFQAGGAAAGIVLARTIARDIYGPENTARIISYLIIATVIGSTLTPTIGGILVDSLGWRSVFVMITAVAVIALAAVVFLLSETNERRRATGSTDRTFDGVRRLLRAPRFWAYAGMGSLSISMFFAFLAAAPYLVVDVMGRSASVYGLWFAVVSLAFVAGNFLSTRLLRRVGSDILIRTGAYSALVVTAIGVAAYAFLPLSPLVLFLPATAVSFVQGLVIPNCMAGAMDVDPVAAGAGAGLTTFFQMSTGAICSQILGILENGTIWPLAGMLCVLSIGGAALAPVLRPARRAERPKTP